MVCISQPTLQLPPFIQPGGHRRPFRPNPVCPSLLCPKHHRGFLFYFKQQPGCAQWPPAWQGVPWAWPTPRVRSCSLHTTSGLWLQQTKGGGGLLFFWNVLIPRLLHVPPQLSLYQQHLLCLPAHTSSSPAVPVPLSTLFSPQPLTTRAPHTWQLICLLSPCAPRIQTLGGRSSRLVTAVSPGP